MTTRQRLDALEHLLADLRLHERCPACRAPHRKSSAPRIDADTAGGVCGLCRRVLDHDGLPFTGGSVMLVIGNYPPEAPVIAVGKGDDAPLCWGGDGLPVVIDSDHVITITRGEEPRVSDQ